ncbi:MAG: hypothetical protein V1690_01855 [Candidatus Moraniibacteriota bacterium]
MKSKNLKKAKKTVKRIQKNSKKEITELQKLAKSKIKSFSQAASVEMGYAKDELAELEEKAKEYIKKHPEKLFMAAAGIGAFVGALTATLIKRKGKRKR